MGLFDNVGSILDLFTQVSTKDVETFSNKAGLSTKETVSILSVAVPLILKAINRNTQTEEGLLSFDKALNDHADDPDFNHVGEYIASVDETDSSKMLNHVLPEQEGIIDRLANTFNISPAAVKRVLLLVVPILVSYFAKNKQNNNLSPEEVRRQTERVANEDLVRKQRDGGIIGDLLGGLFEGNEPSTQTQSNSRDGLLGSLFDLLK